MRALHDPHRRRTRPAHRLGQLNLPAEIRLRPLRHGRRSRSFPGMPRLGHHRAGSRKVSVRRRRLRTRLRTRNRLLRRTLRNNSRRVRHNMQPAGLLRRLNRTRPAHRTGAGPIRTKPHPLWTTPITPRHQRNDITPRTPGRLRGLPRRHHHTRTRTISGHQHHRTRIHITGPATHELRNPTVRQPLRRHRHQHGVLRQPHRKAGATSNRGTRRGHSRRGIHRHRRIRQTTARASRDRFPRNRTRVGIHPYGRPRNGCATPRKSLHVGPAVGVRNRPSHRRRRLRDDGDRRRIGLISATRQRLFQLRVDHLCRGLHPHTIRRRGRTVHARLRSVGVTVTLR